MGIKLFLRNNFWLFLILLLALFLRVYRLDQIPPSLFGDEIDVGYQAYSILKTGKDLSGRFLPFYLKSLTEYRTPLYIYSDVPFIALFGLNEWGVRLSAVFWGLISILGIYLVGKNLASWKVGIAAGLFSALSPWHLQYSRAGFEVTMLLSFIIFATYFFLKGLQNSKYLILSALLFGLSPYIYSTAVVFAPLWLLALLVIFSKQILKEDFLNKSKVFLGVSLLVLFLATSPALYSLMTGIAKERFNGVSIFQNTVLLDKLNIARKDQNYYLTSGEIGHINPFLERLFHNKPSVFVQEFSLNYLRAFSFDFLFSTGDPNFRHSIHEMGELYFFELILLLVGIFAALTQLEIKKKALLLTWLIIAPIPAALTFDGGYHATRLFLMLPAIVLLDSLGLLYLWKSKDKILGQCLLLGLGIVIMINIIFYLHRYYVHYPIESWRAWQQGFRQSMQFIKDNQDNYQQIVMNNTYEPSLIRFLFWTKYNPELVQSQINNLQERENILPSFTGYSLDNKFYFGYHNKGKVIDFVKPGMLYMVSQQDEVEGDWDWEKNTPDRILVLKTVRDPYGNPIFYLVTAK